MLRQSSLLKLLPVVLLSVVQCAGIMNLGCELSPPKVMAQQQGDENAKLERLIQQLKSANDTERNNAAISLGKMGTSARSAIGLMPSVQLVRSVRWEGDPWLSLRFRKYCRSLAMLMPTFGCQR